MFALFILLSSIVSDHLSLVFLAWDLWESLEKYADYCIKIEYIKVLGILSSAEECLKMTFAARYQEIISQLIILRKR